MSYNKLIESLDLSMVKMKLCDVDDGKGWTASKADEVESEYKRFLILIGRSDSVVPTKEVDEMWHQHILDTRAYAADCQRIFGRFIHHFPYLGMRGDEDRKNLERKFAETNELYSKTFGKCRGGCDSTVKVCSELSAISNTTLSFSPSRRTATIALPIISSNIESSGHARRLR